MRRSAAAWGLWAATAAGPVQRTIIEDTGLEKQGTQSVGVARQYTGTAGKVTNCQVAVTLSVTTDHDAVPIDIELYLPDAWASEEVRRRKAKLPDAVLYEPKWRLALDLLQRAHAEGIPLGDVVLADADDGRAAGFRQGIGQLGLAYGVGVQSTQQFYYRGRCWTAAELAAAIPAGRYERIAWREGSRGEPLSARFALRRVRVSNADKVPHVRGTSQWLVVEWRDGEDKPTRFYLSTRPHDWPPVRLVGDLHERDRTERIYEDLKGELGFDHYEGRGWVGWNHHMSVVLCCYALLIGERLLAFPPSASGDTHPGAHARAA